jgi:hypothetical protein
MINLLFRTIFGCAHHRTTFPLTPSRKSIPADGVRKGTYVVCLDCGGEFDYNWKEMRIGGSVQSVSMPQGTVHTTQQVVN